MRATDIIRSVLDLIDQVDTKEAPGTPVSIENEPGEQTSRFKQILAMISNPSQGPLANSPNEVVAPLSAVTTDAGGGINGPKHVDDIRTAHPRQYGNN